jgi:hypothetical protein
MVGGYDVQIGLLELSNDRVTFGSNNRFQEPTEGTAKFDVWERVVVYIHWVGKTSNSVCVSSQSKFDCDQPQSTL